MYLSCEQELALAEKYGFESTPDPKRGGSWCHFSQGTTRVWQGSPTRPWVRALLIDNKFTEHQSFEKLEDALSNNNGKPF